MIQLQLDLNEINQILEALGQQQYKDVFQLVSKIQQQAHSQLKNDDKTPTVGSAPPEGGQA